MDSIYFELTGDVTVGVTITELADGSLQFDLQVLTETGTIGDLNALYFDILDASLLDGLSVTESTDVTGEKYQEDKVTKIDNFTNVNGEVVNEYGKFDLGIQFGTSGMAEDDIQSTSFVLSHGSEVLTIEQFLGQDAAVRLTSVGEIDGAREDSVKIGGTADPIVSGPDHIANTDTMRVSENEDFNPDGFFNFDPLNTDGFSFSESMLDNDTTDGGTYTGALTGVEANGVIVEPTDGMIVEGTNGGFLKVYSDGKVDFSASDIDLVEGQEIETYFTYEIEGGSTAQLIVTVFGEPDDTGGGGGGGLDGGTGGSGDGTDGIDPDLLPPDDPFGF